MCATWYSFGFLSEPKAEIREAVGIQFDLSTCQAWSKHTGTMQSPRWAEEVVWHRRWPKVAGWTWIHQLSHMWSALPLQAAPLQCTSRLSRGCCFFCHFLSSMQIEIFQILFRVPFKEKILSRTVLYISLQTCCCLWGGWRLCVVQGEWELHGIFLGLHPLLLTKYPAERMKAGWCWVHVWEFSKTALEDGDKG